MSRKRPPGEGCEANRAGDLLKFRAGKAAAVTRANQGAYARSGNDPNWNAFFFEDFQNSDVSNAAGETSA